LLPPEDQILSKNFKNTVAELDEMLKLSYSYAPSLKDEEMFVLHTNLDVSQFHILFSSKSLLKNAISQSRKKLLKAKLQAFFTLTEPVNLSMLVL